MANDKSEPCICAICQVEIKFESGAYRVVGWDKKDIPCNVVLCATCLQQGGIATLRATRPDLLIIGDKFYRWSEVHIVETGALDVA